MQIFIINLQHKIPVPLRRVKKAVHRCGREMNLKIMDLSVVFVGKDRMRRMNREFLGHDWVTDVLTFFYSDAAALQAEIIVCPSLAVPQGKRYGQRVDQEILLYVIHGLLHLCGYDDRTEKDRKAMRQKEAELLAKI